MKKCEGSNCEIEFEPNSPNQRYAHPTCRKSIDTLGLCKFRKENGFVPIPDEDIAGEAIVNDLDLRVAYSKLWSEYDKLKNKQEELSSAVYRAVRDSIDLDNYQPVKVREKARESTKDSEHEEVAVAVLADWQLAKVTPDYNSTVCEERIHTFAEKIIDLTNIQRADHPVRKIHVWALGDIVEGELIFPGQSFLIDGGIYRQVTVDGPRILRSFLNTMLENFDEVCFTGVIGNHGSLGGRARRDHDPETNADRMLYRIVSLMFEREPRISFNIPDGRGERNWYAVDVIGNYRALLCHGDQFGSLSSFYTFQKKAYGWKVGAIDEDFDDIYIGHFHTPTKMTFNTIQLRISGSPESTNTYAIESLAAVGQPSQQLLFVHPNKGIVTGEYTCWL